MVELAGEEIHVLRDEGHEKGDEISRVESRAETVQKCG